MSNTFIICNNKIRAFDRRYCCLLEGKTLAGDTGEYGIFIMMGE